MATNALVRPDMAKVCHEKDVAETQDKPYADVEAHAVFDFAHREGHPDDGEDEGGGGHGVAALALHFEVLDVGDAALFLTGVS